MLSRDGGRGGKVMKRWEGGGVECANGMRGGREEVEHKSDRVLQMTIEVLRRRTSLSWLWHELEQDIIRSFVQNIR